jgi:hypothetical protein
MRRTSVVLLLGLIAANLSCWDSPPTAPTALQPSRPLGDHSTNHCTASLSSYASIAEQLEVLFGPGSPNLNSAMSKLNETKAFIDAGEYAKAESHALKLIDFVQQKNSQRELPGYTPERMAQFINSLTCYVRIADLVGEFGPQDDVWILDKNDPSMPDDDPSTTDVIELNSDARVGGVAIPKAAFDNIILVAFKHITKSYETGKGPLNTKLDQYPAFFELVTSWLGDFREDVTVGTCTFSPPGELDTYGRVGHRAPGEGPFRVLEYVDVSAWLDCHPPAVVESRLDRRGSGVMTSDFVAFTGHTRGFGGSTSSFSAFGTVSTKGGFGGSTTLFDPLDAALFDAVALPASCNTLAEGSWVTSDCMPTAYLGTSLWFSTAGISGNAFDGVNVTFTLTGNGGIAAVPGGGDCTTATPTTQVTVASSTAGQVKICWQLGSGEATVQAAVAKPYTGDLAGSGYEDVVFDPATLEWTLTPVTLNPMSFSGFYRPVENTTSNRVRAASSVPIKFSLGGDQGLDIFATGFPKSYEVNCNTLSSDLNTVTGTLTAGASGLKYDATAAHYTYVWKTDKSWGGKCRIFEMKLSDNSTHTLLFSFER